MKYEHYLLKLTHAADGMDPVPEELTAGLIEAGVEPLQGYRSADGWFMVVRCRPGVVIDDLRLPSGWSLSDILVVDEKMRQTPANDLALRLGDPLAFAFLQWPAVIALFRLPTEGWGLLLILLLAAWLVLSTLSGYLGRYGRTPQFGNALLCANLSIALAVWLQPQPWSLLAVGFAMLLLYVAQRALIRPSVVTA